MKNFLKVLSLLLILWGSVFLFSEYSRSSDVIIDEKRVWIRSTELYQEWNRDDHLSYLHTYESQDGQIRYVDSWLKESEVIVLLHGTPTSSYLWRKIVPWLVVAWYRVIVPDLLWYGASDKPVWRELYSSMKQSRRVIALLDELWVDSFVLWWHDQWSLWMREIVTTFPERVSNLIVFNSIFDRNWFHAPSMYGNESVLTKAISWARWSKILGRVVAHASFWWWMVTDEYLTDATLEWYLAPLYDWAGRTNYYFISDFETVYNALEVVKKKLPVVPLPTTVIWWSEDTILVAKDQIPIIQDLMNIAPKDIHILDQTKHFIQEEKPKQIVRLIIDFLSQK